MEQKSLSGAANIPVNGRKQIIEMLRAMESGDKQKLLENIRRKNPQMARQLSEESVSFEALAKINSAALSKILSFVNPQIIGLALYLTDNFTKATMLKALRKDEAETAFEVLSSNLSQRLNDCEKAQRKILQMAIELSKKGLVHL